MKIKTLIILTIVLSAFASAQAQVASNPPYVLEQAVIAGGGGQNSTGGTFSLDGTIGQAVADTNGASGSSYKVQSGFFTAAPLAPTAASVSISGRLLTADGRGLTNARVILTDANGTQRVANTSSFGYFRFNEVEVGQTYIISVVSKRYQFTTQIVTVLEEVVNLEIIALP